MKKVIYIVLGVAVLAVAIFLAFFRTAAGPALNLQNDKKDYKNVEYTIDGQGFLLVDGIAEVEIENSASKVVVSYFGNELHKDLNDDGREDVVFLMTEELGGSGTFFYVVAALNTEEGYVGGEAMLLGDRIAPQTTESGPGKSVIVNYADRLPSEPMTIRPSVGKSLRLILDPQTMQFGVVADNFEGEADSGRMSLTMKDWEWQKTVYGDGKEIEPKNPDTFILTFNSDGTFGARTDCNRVGGKYSTKSTVRDEDNGKYTEKDGDISFSDMVSTKMYCEGSQEADFVTMLQEASEYLFTGKGELILSLESDKGTVVFK